MRTAGIGAEQFAVLFKSFLAELKPDVAVAALGPRDNLFDAGALDSLSMTRVVVFLEDLLDEEIDLELLTIDNFATIEAIFGHVVRAG